MKKLTQKQSEEKRKRLKKYKKPKFKFLDIPTK